MCRSSPEGSFPELSLGSVEGAPLPAGYMFPSGSWGVVVGTKGTDCDVSVSFVVTGGVCLLGMGGLSVWGLLCPLDCAYEAPGPCDFCFGFVTVWDFPFFLEREGGDTESLRLFTTTIWAVNTIGVTKDGSFENFVELRTVGKEPNLKS